MHANSSLPPVGVKVLVKVEDIWIEGIRKGWVTNRDNTFLLLLDNDTELTVKRKNTLWRYP